MARPTLFAHRKFMRLARLVGDEAKAVGHLEFLWHTANESGEDRLGDSDDVEAVARWRGARGELTGALESAGFIDKQPDGSYLIHDYWDHCPTYVRRRREREKARKARGNGDGRHHEPEPAPEPETTSSGKPAATLIPDDFQPNDVNRQWLEEAGLSEPEIETTVSEFVRWAKNAELRRSNWQQAFARNPFVKTTVGRAKSKGATRQHQSKAERVREIQQRAIAAAEQAERETHQ